jgi:hypothetical protein
VSKIWFAQSRLAYSTTGFKIWARPDDVGETNEVITIVSRIMEKGTAYVVAMIREIFDGRPDLQRYANVCFWADGAPNLKNARLFGTIGFSLLERYNWWSVTPKTFAPHHGKTAWIDGHFGTLSKIKATAALEMHLVDVSDIVGAYRRWFGSPSRVIDKKVKYTFIEFVPPPRDSITITAFTLKSIGPIRHNYNWEVLRVDKRRKNLRGSTEATKDVLTGLKVRCSAFTGAPWKLQDFPVLRNEEVKKPDDEGDEAIEEEKEAEQEPDLELLCTTKFFNGWRCSYSKLDGDEAAHTRFRAYLEKAAASMGDFAARAMDEPTRHKPNTTLKANELERLEKKGKVASLRATYWRGERRS